MNAEVYRQIAKSAMASAEVKGGCRINFAGNNASLRNLASILD